MAIKGGGDVSAPVKRCHACQGEAHPGDDHPKTVVMGIQMTGVIDGEIVTGPAKIYHFDCIPAEIVATLENAPQHARTMETIRAARGGLHGDELRQYNAGLPDDNQVVLEDPA